jgi:hypothetical protein
MVKSGEPPEKVVVILFSILAGAMSAAHCMANLGTAHMDSKAGNIVQMPKVIDGQEHQVSYGSREDNLAGSQAIWCKSVSAPSTAVPDTVLHLCAAGCEIH